MADSGSKKRLGRGLAALIGEMDDSAPVLFSKGNESKSDSIDTSELKADRQVAIELIRANPNNPRRTFSEEHLADLARSISEHGIVQPILVRPIKDEDLGGAQYEIIAGERRWRAAQKAALHDIPIIIRDVEDRIALELAIIENVQRADLNPVEEALGYQQLIDDYDYTQSDLGGVIGKSRSHVANTLRLLKLPEKVQTLVSSGELSAGHARALVTSEDPLKIANMIVGEGLSVRQVEELMQQGANDDGGNDKKSGKPQKLNFKSSDTKALEKQLEDILGLKVDIRDKNNGKGELRLKYSSLDQLEDICKRLEKK